MYEAYGNCSGISTIILDQMIINCIEIDKSGIVVFYLNKKLVTYLREAFRKSCVEKKYEAFVCGNLCLYSCFILEGEYHG